MLFQVRLLKREFNTNRTHLIPSQIEVANALLQAIDTNHKDYASIEQYFHKSVPVYYIPDYKIEDGKAKIEESTFYINFTMSMPRARREYVENVAKSLTTFLGQPAAWSVSEEKVEFNCFRAATGTLVGGFGASYHYLHNELLPKAPVTFSAPQKVVMAIEGVVKEENALKLTNSLHKRIVSEFPNNHQAVGHYMNEFVPEDESIFLFWKAEKGLISHVIIEAMTGITDEIIDFLANGFEATFFQEETDLKFSMESNEYTSLTESSNHYVSKTPVNIPMAVKDNSLTKCANVTVIQNILTILGIEEKVNKSNLSRVDDFVIASTEALGELCVKATKVSDTTQIRGGRSSSGGSYQVEVVCEKPISLISIGAHRKYGAGRLTPVA